jgi:Receptor family ligand binding region/7 transmembrane sweet-taste receptor of 3 GCPR
MIFSREQTATVRSLRYYQDLRNSSLPFRTKTTSQIVEVELESQQHIRLMHLAQILPHEPTSANIYMNAAGVLALRHFNERSNVVVPNLSETLDGCNIYMTMDLLDSQHSPYDSIAEFHSYFRHEQTLHAPHPTGVVGAFVSVVSMPLSVLTGAYEIPQISPASTAAVLDDSDTSPMFGRTIPTNLGDATATAIYLKSLGVTHFGIIFVGDDYGISFVKDLSLAAEQRGIKTVTASFQEGDPLSTAIALKILKQSNLRYIFAITYQETFARVLEQAYAAGLVGDEYVWFLPELDPILEPGYSLNRESQGKVAAVIQGSFVVGLEQSPHPEFEESLSSFRTDQDFQAFFLELHRDPSPYAGVTFSDLSQPLSRYPYTTYDAVIALGLAACQADDYFVKGPALFEQIKNTTFDGASGPVVFDPITCTRKFETLEYSFSNVFANDAMSDNETVVFQSRVSTIIDFNAKDVVIEVHKSIYHDGTTTRPSSLPPMTENLNLVPVAVIAVGWCLAGILIMCCAVLAWWLYKCRNKHVVRTAQPLFLAMLLIGTLVMASSIIPMTFQEPTSQRGLDIACMATPWLFVLGFSTSFSAISAKAWRISIVVREAVGMNRVIIRARDVLVPFALLMIINITLLALWTFLDPLVWTRIAVNNTDIFGRSIESYGICKGKNNSSDLALVFAVLLAVTNAIVVVVAFYQVWSTRHFPSAFNESSYIALSMSILLEAFLLGLPILFLVNSTPAAFFIVRVLVVSASCLALLGPTFVPKLWIQHKEAKGARATMMNEWAEYMARHEHHDICRDVRFSSYASGGQRRSRQTTSSMESSCRDEKREESLPSSVAALKASIARRNTQAQSMPSKVAALKAREEMMKATANITEIEEDVAMQGK